MILSKVELTWSAKARATDHMIGLVMGDLHMMWFVQQQFHILEPIVDLTWSSMDIIKCSLRWDSPFHLNESIVTTNALVARLVQQFKVKGLLQQTHLQHCSIST